MASSHDRSEVAREIKAFEQSVFALATTRERWIEGFDESLLRLSALNRETKRCGLNTRNTLLHRLLRIYRRAIRPGQPLGEPVEELYDDLKATLYRDLSANIASPVPPTIPPATSVPKKEMTLDLGNGIKLYLAKGTAEDPCHRIDIDAPKDLHSVETHRLITINVNISEPSLNLNEGDIAEVKAKHLEATTQPSPPTAESDEELEYVSIPEVPMEEKKLLETIQQNQTSLTHSDTSQTSGPNQSGDSVQKSERQSGNIPGMSNASSRPLKLPSRTGLVQDRLYTKMMEETDEDYKTPCDACSNRGIPCRRFNLAIRSSPRPLTQCFMCCKGKRKCSKVANTRKRKGPLQSAGQTTVDFPVDAR